MAAKKTAPKKHIFDIIEGPQGVSLYINDYRVVGPKSNGGRVVRSFVASDEDVKEALRSK